MARKKWTAQTELTDSLLKAREKRKWQVSYRRYVLDRAPSESYARYFGLDIETLRTWFELQFTGGLDWTNFGTAWQFEHILPSAYFDFSNEVDLKLCWSFINIRVEKIETASVRTDLVAAKAYFRNLLHSTGYAPCEKMLEKISAIEQAEGIVPQPLQAFLIERGPWLQKVETLSPDEFNSLNRGSSVDEILLEREILRKFG